MHTLNIVARVVLGLVFVLAGASKVASGRAWPAQAAQLSVPAAPARVVPWFELTVGALLVTGVGQPAITVVALLTLLVFTGVLVHSLRLGRRPPCACFGTFSAAPLGWGHVARNASFVALAVVVLATR